MAKNENKSAEKDLEQVAGGRLYFPDGSYSDHYGSPAQDTSTDSIRSGLVADRVAELESEFKK